MLVFFEVTMHKRHGMSRTGTYKSWASMVDRCRNSNNVSYKLYGARGITYCPEWNEFINFYNDMGDSNGLSLDRIDSNGNYCKQNCRWVTMKVQQNNRRNNNLITYKNKTKSVAQWAEELNINYQTLRYRHKQNWPVERMLTP